MVLSRVGLVQRPLASSIAPVGGAIPTIEITKSIQLNRFHSIDFLRASYWYRIWPIGIATETKRRTAQWRHLT